MVNDVWKVTLQNILLVADGTDLLDVSICNEMVRMDVIAQLLHSKCILALNWWRTHGAFVCLFFGFLAGNALCWIREDVGLIDRFLLLVAVHARNRMLGLIKRIHLLGSTWYHPRHSVVLCLEGLISLVLFWCIHLLSRLLHVIGISLLIFLGVVLVKWWVIGFACSLTFLFWHTPIVWLHVGRFCA